ncbi:Sre G protein-coupled chemoreceptor [Ancylostoma ceylanicum]|uniref:Sre G protein-coupled chemoreceptor n=1 Tax=Ancylostoma ceylanicum TaxID=53326 RepID=A0A0D6L738_9BILA|nr:Sre G protein-coupled chemoreceptor [Ancylostoma ceylanicum]
MMLLLDSSLDERTPSNCCKNMLTFMNCTKCEVCAAAVNVYAPMSFVHLSLLFRLLLGPICTLGIILLTIAVYQTRTLHYNARLLLMCMTISVMVCNIGVLLDAVYKLFISFVIPEELRCEFQVYKPQYFFALRGVHIVGGLGLALSTMFLAVERALATITYVTYEQHGRRWIGIILTVTQACFLMFYYLSDKVKSFDVATIPQNTKFFGNVIYGLNIIALIVFTMLYLVNRRRKRSLTDSQLRVLSTRFQLRENIATTRLMTPVMFVVALMTTSSQWGIFFLFGKGYRKTGVEHFANVYYFHLPDLDEGTVVTSAVLEDVASFAPYAEYQMSVMPLITLMLIVLLPCFNLHIKRSFVRISHLSACFPERPTSIDAVTVDEARDLYFEKLKGQWHESATHRG